MAREHPRWEEFLARLEGPEGCNFRQADPNDIETLTWDCNGGKNKDYAKKILAEMGGIDIDESLKYFDLNGGHCDCEILFNMAN